MLRAFVLAPCLVLSASVVCQGAQILTNPNFENTPDHGLGWTPNNGVYVTEYSLSSNYMAPGNPPDNNGGWGVQIEQNGGDEWAQGNVRQEVIVAPGLYNVSASALARVFDDGTANPGQFSRARFDLRVDGTVIEQIDLVNNGSTPGWTPWTVMQTSVYQVNVASSLEVRMQLRADARDGSWAQLVADSFVLDAELIPEPGSMALACIGASIACVATHRRRKQR